MNPTVLVCPTTRKQFKQHACVLEDWLSSHQNVYPSKEQKIHLATVAAMSEHQVNRWFANRRRKMKIVDGSAALKESRNNNVTGDEKEKAGIIEADEKHSATAITATTTSDIPHSELQDWKLSTDPNNNPQNSGSPDLLLKEQLEKTLLENYLRNAFLASLLAPQIPLDSAPNPLLFAGWPYLQLHPYSNPFGQHLVYSQQPSPQSLADKFQSERISRETDCCDLPFTTDKRSETPQMRTVDEKESDLLTKETIAVAVLASFALQKRSLDNYDSI